MSYTLSVLDVHATPSVHRRHVRLLRLSLGFLGFLKGALLPNLHKILEPELLIVGVQQLEDVFCKVRTDLRAWLSIIWLGSGGKRRKC